MRVLDLFCFTIRLFFFSQKISKGNAKFVNENHLDKYTGLVLTKNPEWGFPLYKNLVCIMCSDISGQRRIHCRKYLATPTVCGYLSSKIFQLRRIKLGRGSIKMG